MITGQLKSRIDKLWTEFWTGGITNPLTVIEQISFLMFIRLLDINESRREKQAARSGKPFKGTFSKSQQHLRWQNLLQLGGEAMLKTIRDEVFPHFRDIAGTESTFGKYMADAQLMVQKPSLLVSAVSMINDLPLDKTDIKGDLYEYLLSKLTTAGINGQFRSPRHVIRLMVDLLAPKPTDIIGDPACGTAGFLIMVMDYLLEHNTSPDGIITEEKDGETIKIHTGDLLEPYRKHIQSDMFYGFDFDVTMLRIAAMNMMLHGVENPNIEYADTLSKAFGDRDGIAGRFDVILANPPFKGSLDINDIHSSLTGKVKTKKTELLFVVLMLRMLKLGGRCAVIVPDGVLFGSSTAHVALRRLLVEDNQLEAVIKLPAGVFRPYAGVSTAILIFTKGGKTDHVWFYDVENDGFSLDDKRDPSDTNDLPDVRERWAKRDPERDRDRNDKAFFVTLGDIEAATFDLSINRYKERVHEEIEYEAPHTLIKRMRELETEIARDLTELEGMLK